jgi:tetratricopeptide (TPR) repeat protein
MKRHLAHGCLLASLALTPALAGCGAHTQAAPTLAELRARAAEAPGDAELQGRVALGELFSYEGDPARVDAALARALALDPKDAKLLLATGLSRDLHGQPAAALEAYLRALAAALASRDAQAPHLAELSAYAISGLEGAVPGYNAKVRAAFEPLLDDPRVATPARYVIGSVLGQFAYRRGDRPAAQAIAIRLGCVTQMRATGPFGPRELLGFDVQHAVEPGQPLAQSYDLGPDRGVQATRELGARGCSVNLGGGPIARGGTTYAQAYVDAPSDGKYVLRMHVPSAAELFVDGRSALRLDRRRELLPDVVFATLPLRAGRHELLVKVTTRHPNPALAIALDPRRTADGTALALPEANEPSSGFGKYLRATLALGRGDALHARESLRGVSAARPASTLLLMQRAALTLVDPLVPSDRREDNARQLLAAALRRDPGAWNPAVQLASMMAGNGRSKEAIAALREALARWPEVPGVGLTLADLLRKEGWDAEADAVIARVRRRIPDACAPLAAELEALRRRDRAEAAEQTLEALMRCEAQSSARFSLLLRKRNWDEADKELDRLQALEPPQNVYPWLISRLELAKNRGDARRVEQMIAELRARYPRSATGALEHIDRLAGQGDVAGARQVMVDALRAEPASMAQLHRLAPALGGAHVMTPYRRDGKQAITSYEAAGRKYEGPQVLVFDYMAARIFEDGSSIDLVHTVQKAQSDEAVDELGEVNVPEGAEVLKLHVIKPDGARLEPDQIEGKDAVSLPTVVPGDYVEFEYLIYNDPTEAFPQGYAGDRFYFKSFEIPFDHSEMVVVAPQSIAVKNDPRGPAPAAEVREEGDLRVLTFKVAESEPLKVEPGSVTAREYLPSIRIGVKASWEAFVESIRDVLVDRDLHDPEVAALARRVVGDAAPGDRELRAKRLYAWVLENIENDEDVFSQAALMLRARSGSRARVLHYLLELAGVPAELALVRSASADATPSDMADTDTYEHLLVTYEGKQGRVWLFTVERYAPFGFIPPLLAGQPALLLEQNGKRVTLPPASQGEEQRRLELDVALAADGSAHVDAAETVHGSGAVSWRSELESVPDAELEQRFEADYVARLMPGARLSALEIDGRIERSESIALRYGFDVAALGRGLSTGWALPPMLPAKLAHNYAQLAQRSTDQLIGSPLELHVVVRIRLPKGAARPKLPPKVELEAAIPGKPRFTMTSRFEEGALVVERKLAVPLMRVTPESYPAFATFCRQVDAAEAQELFVQLK